MDISGSTQQSVKEPGRIHLRVVQNGVLAAEAFRGNAATRASFTVLKETHATSAKSGGCDGACGGCPNKAACRGGQPAEFAALPAISEGIARKEEPAPANIGPVQSQDVQSHLNITRILATIYETSHKIIPLEGTTIPYAFLAFAKGLRRPGPFLPENLSVPTIRESPDIFIEIKTNPKTTAFMIRHAMPTDDFNSNTIQFPSLFYAIIPANDLAEKSPVKADFGKNAQVHGKIGMYVKTKEEKPQVSRAIAQVSENFTAKANPQSFSSPMKNLRENERDLQPLLLQQPKVISGQDKLYGNHRKKTTSSFCAPLTGIKISKIAIFRKSKPKPKDSGSKITATKIRIRPRKTFPSQNRGQKPRHSKRLNLKKFHPVSIRIQGQKTKLAMGFGNTIHKNHLQLKSSATLREVPAAKKSRVKFLPERNSKKRKSNAAKKASELIRLMLLHKRKRKTWFLL